MAGEPSNGGGRTVSPARRPLGTSPPPSGERFRLPGVRSVPRLRLRENGFACQASARYLASAFGRTVSPARRPLGTSPPPSGERFRLPGVRSVPRLRLRENGFACQASARYLAS